MADKNKNDVQNLENGNTNKIRTSIIRKGIERTVQTAQYESLKISDFIEETISWSTLPERNKKLDNWDTLLLQRFKITHDRILEELGLSSKKAFFKNPVPETIKRVETILEKSKENTDLDTLDILR